jgi:hypothetical protein
MHKLAWLSSRPARAWLHGALFAAVALASAPQTAERTRGGLRVSSTLERLAPKTSGDAAPDAVELVLSVEFTNTSEQVIDGVRITSPVPAHVRYVADSASGPGSKALFSVDGGQTFRQPDELTTLSADGVARAADAAEYTHVRFVLDAPLDAGAKGIARFRVELR